MRLPRLAAAAAFGVALLLPGAAAAQSNVRPIDETAADLAYGLCPLYLAGQLELTDAQLTERGFGTEVETAPGTRFGELKTVKAKLEDGEIVFGGAPGKVCGVTVTGPNGDAALATLRKNMAFTGLDFQAAANVGPTPPPGMTVETFKAPVDTQFLYVQLLRAEGPTPMVGAQLFAMDK
jgi:hypothetical protein